MGKLSTSSSLVKFDPDSATPPDPSADESSVPAHSLSVPEMSIALLVHQLRDEVARRSDLQGPFRPGNPTWEEVFDGDEEASGPEAVGQGVGASVINWTAIHAALDRAERLLASSGLRFLNQGPLRSLARFLKRVLPFWLLRGVRAVVFRQRTFNLHTLQSLREVINGLRALEVAEQRSERASRRLVEAHELALRRLEQRVAELADAQAGERPAAFAERLAA